MLTIRDDQGSAGKAGTPAPGLTNQEGVSLFSLPASFQVRIIFEKIGIWL